MFNCILAGSNNTGLTFGDGANPGCYTGDYNLFHGYNTDRVISTSDPDFSLTQIQNGEWTAYSGQDAHSRVVINSNTLFQDTLADNPDLHLAFGAIAIDNGVNLPDGPSSDFDNCPRNVGQIDIGAFEYGACGSSGISRDKSEDTGYFDLKQNYPNPFEQATKIKFQIQSTSYVSLKVFDILGQEITSLIGSELIPGSYETEFSASGLDDEIYFYVLQAGGYSEMKKMILLK